jgi:putative oxidoreductase
MTIAIAVAVRVILVLLFLPFSALDKILNFNGAVTQAGEVVGNPLVARLFIVAGLGVEIFMSLGVVTGIADRLCAFVLAGYCAATAVLWKRFWAQGDFWSNSAGRGRGLFWDFLKNFALAGGFLLITFGNSASSVSAFFDDPLSSTHPYLSSSTHAS